MLEVECSSEFKLQPTVAIACGKGLAYSRCFHGILVCHLLIVEVKVSHTITIVEVGECVRIESSERVEGSIEHKSRHSAPVAIDVHRLRRASTGHGVVCHHRTD